MSSGGRFGRRRFILLVLYLAPLALSILFMRASRDNPFYAYLYSDGRHYLPWAGDMASGKDFGPWPYFVSPLYLFFLAGLLKAGLASVEGIRIVQSVLGATTYVLVYLLGRRLFSHVAGLWAWALLLGYGTFLQAAADVSPPWLEALLITAVGWILSRGTGRRVLAAGGLAAGLAALARPTMVIFAALVPLFLLAVRRREKGSTASWIASSAVFAAAFMMPILPVTIRNLIAGGDFVLISSHGGINFYIGNSPGAPGVFRSPEGIEPGLMGLNAGQAREAAERDVGHALSPAGVSRYWYGRGLAFLFGHPGEAASLYLRKAFFAAHAYEAASNADYYLLRDRSPVLQALVVPFPLLMVAGLAGLFLSRRRWPGLALIYPLMIAQAGALLLFFVAYRFRLSLAPLLAVFGGHALSRFASAARGKRAWAAGTAALAAVALLSYPYPFVRDMDRQSRAAQHENLGIFLFDRGMTRPARDILAEAERLGPARPWTRLYLARLMERGGDLPGAMERYGAAAALLGDGSEIGRVTREKFEILRRRLEAAREKVPGPAVP